MNRTVLDGAKYKINARQTSREEWDGSIKKSYVNVVGVLLMT